MTPPRVCLGLTPAIMDPATSRRVPLPPSSLSILTRTSHFPIFDGATSDLLRRAKAENLQGCSFPVGSIVVVNSAVGFANFRIFFICTNDTF